MNADIQYEKPLLLLFSDFSIDLFHNLLLHNEDIILRQKSQLLDQQEIFPDAATPPSWNIQFEGIELDITWFSTFSDISEYKQIFCNIDSGLLKSSVAVSLGNHVKNGRKNNAVIGCFFRCIRHLILLSKPTAVAWEVTKILSHSQYCVDAIDHYENGGAFPLLSTIDFIHERDGTVKSNGLSYFSNQEICYDGRHLNQAEAMKRVMRIAHDIAVNGAYSSSMKLDGLQDDEKIFITIANDGATAQIRSIF